MKGTWLLAAQALDAWRSSAVSGRLRAAVLLAALSAGTVRAQPPCAPLAAPAGVVIEVLPGQADGLRAIAARAASGATILLHDGVYEMDAGDAVSRLVFSTPGVTLLSLSGDRAYPDDPYPGLGYRGRIDGVIRNNFIAAADADLFQSDSGFDAGIALEQSRDTWVIHNTVVSTEAPFSSIEWRFANTQVQIINNLGSRNLRERDGNPQEVLAGNLAGAPAGRVSRLRDACREARDRTVRQS